MHQQLADARYYMIGDNAEADLPIYLGIKLFVEQRISTPRYSVNICSCWGWNLK
jgi:hypothetical protein